MQLVLHALPMRTRSGIENGTATKNGLVQRGTGPFDVWVWAGFANAPTRGYFRPWFDSIVTKTLKEEPADLREF